MVCPRCIKSVENILDQIKIEYVAVELGKVNLKEKIGDETKDQLRKSLETAGFELLTPRNSILISRIKSIIIEKIHHSKEDLEVNFTQILTQELNHDYSYLSRLFSAIEGITIEKFIIRQKIEKVKEFIFYDELTLSEISHKLGYSSTAHLSGQFKKETGMTPTQFKNKREPGHRNIDQF